MVKIVQISDIHWRGLERHDEYEFVFNELYKQLASIKPDFIINTGDTWHTKLQHITPEGFRMLRNMFLKLAQHAPVINIYGNHDLNLQNKDRHNILWEVVNSVQNEPDIHPVVLLEKTEKVGVYTEQGQKVWLYPFSVTDTKNWDELHQSFLKEGLSDDIRIALFHGSVLNSTLQNGYKLKEAELDEENFLYDFPFVMLGDIHKRQFLAYRRDGNKEIKPYAAYAGSIVQQDFGETYNEHGFLIWEINNEFDWNITEMDITNPFQMHSLPWNGVEKTLEDIKSLMEKHDLDTRASFRVQHGGIIFSNEVKELKELSYKQIGLLNDNLAFAYSKNIEDEIIYKNSLELKPNITVKSNIDLLYDYLEKAPVLKSLLRVEDYPFVEQAVEKIEKIIQINEKANAGRFVWKVKKLWFDNLYHYGEGNFVDFSTLSGTVGIFGPNRIGKSAMLGAVCYALFNSTDRGSIKDFYVVNENKQYCRAKVHFELNGEDYFVERITTKKPKDETTNSKVNFYKLSKDGVQESLNGGDRNDTDKRIRSIIGTFDDFKNTSLAAQNSLLSFIEKGNTECKKALSRYFNIDAYLALGNEALEDKKKYTERVADRTENSWAEEKNKILTELEIKRLDVLSKEQKLLALNEQLKTLNNELENLSVAEVNKFNLNNQLIAKASNDIQECKEAIEQCVLTLAANIPVVESKQSVIASMQQLTKEYQEALSKFEKTKKEVDSLEKEKAQQVKKLKLLDEIPCGDQFPHCSFIHDSFEAKERLPKLEELIAHANSALVASKAALEALDSDMEARLRSENRLLEAANNAVSKAMNSKAIYEKKLAKEQETLDNLILSQQDILNSGVNLNIDDKIKELSSQIKDINSEISNVRAQIMSGNHDVKEIEKVLNVWEEKYKDFSINLQKLRVMTVIAEAFSKNGIPAQILRDYMDSVNFFAGLVTKDTDFDVRVRIDSDSNSLDIDYVYGGKKRPIETCSGAEKTFAALAIRVALIQCNSIPISNALFLDECFGALDEAMIVIAQQLLTSLETYFETIFIISHESYLKEMIINKIEVVKTDSGHSEIISGELISPDWSEKFIN